MIRALNNTLAVTAKEVRLYATTWVSYTLVAVFLEILAIFFALLVQDFQVRRLHLAETHQAEALKAMNLNDAVLAPLYTYGATCLTFLVPLLTMNLLAGERRAHTLELMLTLPVRASELVLGKAVAASVVLFVMLLTTLPFAWILSRFSVSDPNAIDWATVATSLLGVGLVGLTAVALGILTSALTDSQIVAAVLAFAILLLLHLAGAAAPAQDGTARVILEGLSFGHHLEGFTRGLLRGQDMVYFLSLTAGALALATYRLAAERQR